MKLTPEEKRTTRELYNLYQADAGALRAELCKQPPVEAAMIVLELAQELTTDARERLLGDLRRWTQDLRTASKAAPPTAEPYWVVRV